MSTTVLQTMWVHGHSLQIEDHDALVSHWRSGFCLYVEASPTA